MLGTVTVRVAIFLPSHIYRSFLRLNRNSAFADYQRALLPHNADRSTHHLSHSLPFTHATVIARAVRSRSARRRRYRASRPVCDTLCGAPRPSAVRPARSGGLVAGNTQPTGVPWRYKYTASGPRPKGRTLMRGAAESAPTPKASAASFQASFRHRARGPEWPGALCRRGRAARRSHRRRGRRG